LFLDLSQQPRGVLDLVVDDFAVLRCLFAVIHRPPRDRGDPIEIAFQRCVY